MFGEIRSILALYWNPRGKLGQWGVELDSGELFCAENGDWGPLERDDKSKCCELFREVC